MFYAHNDKSHWGEQFAMACGRAGLKCKLFKRAGEVPQDARAFVRLSQQAEQRDLSKELVYKLHDRIAVVLPNLTDALLYDDKIRQINFLKEHMPSTHVWTSREEAYAVLDHMKYPFVSKASCGAGSANVRLITERAQAEVEIETAFAGGIVISYGNLQKDYVYWQDFVGGNEGDYRVIIVGKYVFGLRRKNRPNIPFASGSGNFEFIESFYDGRERECAELALKLAKEIGSQWIAFDFVFDGLEPKVLEVSASWTTHAYACCPMFYTDSFDPAPYRGGHMFDIAVEILHETLL